MPQQPPEALTPPTDSDTSDADGEPEMDSVQQLVDMGFAAEDVAQAMRACRGNSEAALSFLLGDRPASVVAALTNQLQERLQLRHAAAAAAAAATAQVF